MAGATSPSRISRCVNVSCIRRNAQSDTGAGWNHGNNDHVLYTVLTLLAGYFRDHRQPRGALDRYQPAPIGSWLNRFDSRTRFARFA